MNTPASPTAVPIIKATWCGDSSVLHIGAEVDVLAIDHAGQMSRSSGAVGVPARIAAWIRHWPAGQDYAQFRSCDLADLEMSDEDFDALTNRPDHQTGEAGPVADMREKIRDIVAEAIWENFDSDDGHTVESRASSAADAIMALYPRPSDAAKDTAA